MSDGVQVEQEHAPIPVWRSVKGKRYCGRYELHGEWVEWPCEEAK